MVRSPHPDEVIEALHACSHNGELTRGLYEYDLLTYQALTGSMKAGIQELESVRVSVEQPRHWTEEPFFAATSTGDPLIDKWEREIAAGLTPDLNET